MDKRERYEKLIEIGCILCQERWGIYTPAEIHHLRSMGSAGKRASWEQTIPLCPAHHRTGGYGVAYHAGKDGWEQSNETSEARLYDAVQREIERRWGK